MRPLSARLIVTLSLATLVACTTVRPVVERGTAPLSAQQVGSSIARGDRLSVTRTDGTMLQLTVTNVLPESIEAIAAGESVARRIELDQIKKIERREVDGVKTTLLGVGVFVLLGLAAQSFLPPSY